MSNNPQLTHGFLNCRMFDVDRSGTIDFDEFWYLLHLALLLALPSESPFLPKRVHSANLLPCAATSADSGVSSLNGASCSTAST